MRTPGKNRWKWVVVALAVSFTELGLVGLSHAIIGRPFTPMSYAGVARRTTRRTVAAGAAMGAAAATPYPYPYW